MWRWTVARSAKPKPLAKYRTSAGTPNELETAEHATPALAKGWLESRMRARYKWAERYSHDVRDQLTPILEQLSYINLSDAKKGRAWEWRAVDDVSRVQFVFKIEVLY